MQQRRNEQFNGQGEIVKKKKCPSNPCDRLEVYLSICTGVAFGPHVTPDRIKWVWKMYEWDVMRGRDNCRDPWPSSL